MLKIVITIQEESIPKTGIAHIEHDGKGEIFAFDATDTTERDAVIQAIHDAFDRLEGLVERPEATTPIVIPTNPKPASKSVTKSASKTKAKAKAVKTEPQPKVEVEPEVEEAVEDWMKPSFKGQALKFKKGNI